MTTHDIKRYTISGDIAYPIHEDPEGDYVSYEDHVAAIEADRKRRGEQRVIGRIKLDGNRHPRAELSTGYDENGDQWKEGTPIYAAPQPAEPVSVPKHLIERLRKHCENKDNTAFARSTMREALQYLTAEPVKVPSDDLQGLSDRAYCQYIEQMRRPECLGWEQKVKDRRFGEAELKAHTKAGEFLGRHRAFSEAAALLARYGKEAT